MEAVKIVTPSKSQAIRVSRLRLVAGHAFEHQSLTTESLSEEKHSVEMYESKYGIEVYLKSTEKALIPFSSIKFYFYK